MSFFTIPEGQEGASENVTRRALNRFLDALLYGNGEDETRAILEQERQILPSPTADQLLATLISPVPDTLSRERLFQEYFQIHLTLLRRVPWAGIPLAFGEFEADAEVWKVHVEEYLTLSSGKTMSAFRFFYRWAQISTKDIRRSRRFLEKHLDLLASQHDALLVQGIASEQEEMMQKNTLTPEELIIYIKSLYNLLALLRDARVRGGTVTAVQDAYVNLYNGFVLDLPDWLDRVRDSLNATNQEGNRTAKGRMILLAHHIRQAEQDPAVPSQTLAQLYVEFGAALVDNLHTDRAASYEYALGLFDKALTVYTHERYPYQHALVQSHKGVFYLDRVAGEQRANIEQALLCFRQALEVHTYELYPDRWAALQGNLGYAYLKRIEGPREDNQEEAIIHIQKALEFFTPQTQLANINLEHLRSWTRLQSLLSNIYRIRLNGESRDNLEQAIVLARQVTTVISPQTLPTQWAQAQVNLGNAYDQRIAGDPQENKHLAMQCYEAALTIFTRDAFPPYWADIQNNLGTVYRTAPGDAYDNQKKALAHFKAALEVKTVEAFPVEHRNIQLNISGVEAERQDWQGVHEACLGARKAEELLLQQSTSVYGHDGVLRSGPNPAIFDGYALACLKRPMEAAVAIEQGRARGLAQAFALEFIEPDRIQDEQLRIRYEAAYQDFITNQALLNKFALYDITETEHLRNKENLAQLVQSNQQALTRIIAEIHRTDNPPGSRQETFTVAKTILKTVQDIGPGHALAYIIYTPWGGAAVAVLSTPPSSAGKTHFYSLNLPQLDGELITDLLTQSMPNGQGKENTVGGFGFAQLGYSVLEMFAQWPGTTLCEQATAVHANCAQAHIACSLDRLAITVLHTEQWQQWLDRPLETLSHTDLNKLDANLRRLFRRAELERGFLTLAKVAMQPLINWLRTHHVVSLTLIPCGLLAAFPLTAIPLADGQTVSETLPTSVAPSAYALQQRYSTRERTGIYALGNPHPTHQELKWGEAEANIIVRLASAQGLPAEGVVKEQATREWLVEKLQKGLVVSASCHGQFDVTNFMRSSLLLAGNTSLSLAEMLGHIADLRGLRLLILSACQTAIIDLLGAPDEVRSLAAGTLQAGARATLGSLWTVSDKATYHLIARFADEWFPNIKHEAPAAALARAQAWLRTVKKSQLEKWTPTILPLSAQDALRSSEATEELSDILADVSRDTGSPLQNVPHTPGEKQTASDIPTYENPIYWAGFQIMGW